MSQAQQGVTLCGPGVHHRRDQVGDAASQVLALTQQIEEPHQVQQIKEPRDAPLIGGEDASRVG